MICANKLTACSGIVNPQAVNEPGFDVFTDNKRSVLYMTHSQSNAPVAFVAIGAMLVRSASFFSRCERNGLMAIP